uniref:SnoaL-like domain-containing protein n=1 Tax=Bicosoecida sp. CB-2014 TaxID=1486930 RepID=A0A7S1G286_9STRA
MDAARGRAAAVALPLCLAVVAALAGAPSAAAYECGAQQAIVDEYLFAAFAHGNLSHAMKYTTNDDSFYFHWMSTTAELEKVGFAHTLSGANALFTFFGAVLSDVSSFSFGPLPDPSVTQTPIPGMETLAALCDDGAAPAFVVKRWFEHSTSLLPGSKGVVDNAENVAIYEFNPDGTKIATVFVWVDIGKYIDAFGEQYDARRLQQALAAGGARAPAMTNPPAEPLRPTPSVAAASTPALHGSNALGCPAALRSVEAFTSALAAYYKAGVTSSAPVWDAISQYVAPGFSYSFMASTEKLASHGLPHTMDSPDAINRYFSGLRGRLTGVKQTHPPAGIPTLPTDGTVELLGVRCDVPGKHQQVVTARHITGVVGMNLIDTEILTVFDLTLDGGAITAVREYGETAAWLAAFSSPFDVQ